MPPLHNNITIDNSEPPIARHYSAMIVPFTDRLSDGPRSRPHSRSDPLRTIDHYVAGSMIVAFDNRSRRSTDKKSRHANALLLGKSAPSAPIDPPLQRRAKRGGISRKKTSPAPAAPMDPIAVSWRQLHGKRMSKPNRRERPRREGDGKKKPSVRQSPRSEVIVEFPERDCAARREVMSLGRMMRKTRSDRWLGSRPATPRVEEQPAKIYCSASARHIHSRQFEETVDWRNTTIDWGDEDLVNFTEPSADVPVRQDPIGRKHGGAKAQGNTELAESSQTILSGLSDLSHSLTSLLSIRKGGPRSVN